MRILHIISSSGMYGAEAVILNLSRTINSGIDRSVVGIFSNTTNQNLQLYEAALAGGVETHLIPCSGQVDRTVLTSIRKLVADTGIDVVHAHGYKADIYTHLALRETRTPYVSTCHTWYDNDLKVKIYGVADRFVLRRFAAVVAVSDEVSQRLLKAGVRKDRIYSIRNGIDLRLLTGATPVLRTENGWRDKVLVGLVGRLAQEKGVDLFLRAAAIVLRDSTEVKFVVAGEGPDRAQLESLIGELGIGEGVTLLGRRDDMQSVYASLDIMVSSSRQEGLPMAILEGMGSQRAIVATAVGELPSVIQDGVSGVLVAREDIGALAAKINELIVNRELREKLGLAARQRVELEFSAERMTSEYMLVYEKAIATISTIAAQIKPHRINGESL